MTSAFDFAASLMNVESIVMLLTAIAAFATILTLAASFVSGDKLSTRMKYVSTEREAMRARAREALTQERTRLRHTPKGFVKEVVERFASGRMLENAEIREKLRQAGFRGPGPMYTFIFFRFVMPPVTFLLTLLYLAFVDDLGLAPVARFAISCAAAFIGFYLPNVFVQNVITRRQDSIRKAFPDALDLLLICVESGMSIEAALQKVAAEIGAVVEETSIEKIAGRLVQELSGGEQARVHLARVLAQIWEPVTGQGPRWLFLDEPVAALDIGHQLTVMRLARSFADAGGGVVAVMHDLNLSAMFANRMALIVGGRLAASGHPSEVLTDDHLSCAYGCPLRVNRAPSTGPWLVPQAVV